MGRASKKVKKVIGVISSSSPTRKRLFVSRLGGAPSPMTWAINKQHDSLYRNANESDVKFVF